MTRRRVVALEVHVDDRVPLVLGEVHEHAVADDPRVVDEDVEATEVCDRLLDHVLRALEVGDVVVVGGRLTTRGLDLVGHGLSWGRVLALTG